MRLLELHIREIEKDKKFLSLSEDQIKLLNKPLPFEAIKETNFGAKLTSVNVAFVNDIFNEIFGVGGYIISSEAKQVEKDIIAHVEFYAPLYGIYRAAYGGNAVKTDLGDAYKGAVTDATTKISSQISSGINLIWKNIKPESKNNELEVKNTANSSANSSANSLNTINTVNTKSHEEEKINYIGDNDKDFIDAMKIATAGRNKAGDPITGDDMIKWLLSKGWVINKDRQNRLRTAFKV